MILLDTNVLSELMRPFPQPVVEQWLAQQPAGSVFTTSITEAELRYGAALLPEGGRRVAMAAAIEGLLRVDLSGRILSFDSDAAIWFAEIAAKRRATGRPMSQSDAQIAAIARTRSAILATRNVADFMDCGIGLFNPWTLRD